MTHEKHGNFLALQKVKAAPFQVVFGMLCLGHNDFAALAIYVKLRVLKQTICNASVITINRNLDKI